MLYTVDSIINNTRKPPSGLYWRYTAAGTTVDFEGVPFSVGEKNLDTTNPRKV